GGEPAADDRVHGGGEARREGQRRYAGWDASGRHDVVAQCKMPAIVDAIRRRRRSDKRATLLNALAFHHILSALETASSGSRRRRSRRRSDWRRARRAFLLALQSLQD